jgi:DNA-binding beta-propeller fold protein YncE
MKFTSKIIAAAVVASSSVISAMETICDTPYAVVANRGAGSISVVSSDGSTNFMMPLPTASDATNSPEPMYVNYSRNKVYVGDRANNAVVVMNPKDFMEEATIISNVCQGIFHQWSNDEKLVVACDIDNTIAVIKLEDNSIKAVVDLMNQGALSISANQKPHDIVVTPSGDAIFVTIVATDDSEMDAVLKIDTNTGMVVKRIDLPNGTDPHVGLSAASPDLLYSPQQNLGIVAVYSQNDLTEVQSSIAAANAHGIGIPSNGEYVYVTNIADGGAGGLVTIKAATEGSDATLVGTAVDTPEAVPHNAAVDNDGFVFVTHSGGSANQLSVYSTDALGLPTFMYQHTVGTNPFGLAIVEYRCRHKPTGTKSAKRAKGSKRA